MQRRTAVAAAAAISMSLVSAVAAVGANLGALGFAASSPAPAASVSRAPTAPASAQGQPARVRTPAHADGEREGAEREGQRRQPSSDEIPRTETGACQQGSTMTDPGTDADRAERIRRLQERRAAPARKRRHPAAGTRWLLGGLGIASFFTIAGSVAVANQANVRARTGGPSAVEHGDRTDQGAAEPRDPGIVADNAGDDGPGGALHDPRQLRPRRTLGR